MNKKIPGYCVFFLFILMPAIAFAKQQQEPVAYPDSLLRLARLAGSDSARIALYFELSNYWSDRDTAKAFTYIREARKYIRSSDNYHQALIHFYTGGVLYTRNIPLAKNEYMQAESMLKNFSTPIAYRYRSRLWNNYGTLLQYENEDDSFLNIIVTRAIPLARAAGDSILSAHNLHNIGMVLANVREYEQAAPYYEQSMLSLSHYTDAHEDRLTVFVNAAKNALNLEKTVLARRYLDSASVEMKAIPYSIFAPVYYRTEGNYFRQAGRKDDALLQLDNGIVIAQRNNDKVLLYDLYYGKYATYKQFGDYEDAKRSLTKAMTFLEDVPLAQSRILAVSEMAEIETKLGNHKSANNWIREYMHLKDSSYQTNLKLNILELDRKFKDAEKRNEILVLKEKSQRQQLVIEKNRWWIVLLAAGLLIAFILLYFNWTLQKQRKRAALQNEVLHAEQLKSIRQQEKLKQYNSVLTAAEQERNRVARDLHDGLGAMLAGVKWKLLAIGDMDKDMGQQNRISKVAADLDSSIDELRRVARNMLPTSLLYMGLEPALADLCKSLDTPNCKVSFQSIGLRGVYPEDLSTAVFRIVQELLTNALRHSRASQVIVQCSEADQRLYVTVEDNGIGFNAGADSQTGTALVPGNDREGMGLTNIRNRVEILQGKLVMESSRDAGTSCEIEIPLNSEKQ